MAIWVYLCPYTMKKIISLLLLAFFVKAAVAQTDTLEARKNAKSNADAMMTAFRSSDWSTFAAYTNDKLVETIGGQEAYTKVLTTSMKQLFENAKVDTVCAGNVLQLLKTPGGYQCITESFLQITISGAMATLASYEIGTSANGINWKFLRVDDNGSEFTPKTFIPDISPELIVPNAQVVPGITLAEFLKTYTPEYGPKKESELEEKIAGPEEIITPVPVKKPVKKPAAKTPVKTKSKPKTKS